MARFDQMVLIDLFADEDKSEGKKRIANALKDVYKGAGIENAHQLSVGAHVAEGTASKAFHQPEKITLGTLKKLCSGLGIDYERTLSRIIYGGDGIDVGGILAAYETQKAMLARLAERFLLLDADEQANVIAMVDGLRKFRGNPSDNALSASLALRRQVRDALKCMQYPNEF